MAMALKVKGGQGRSARELVHTGNVMFALVVIGGLGLLAAIVRSWL